jgi:hypothetical protein
MSSVIANMYYFIDLVLMMHSPFCNQAKRQRMLFSSSFLTICFVIYLSRVNGWYSPEEKITEMKLESYDFIYIGCMVVTITLSAYAMRKLSMDGTNEKLRKTLIMRNCAQLVLAIAQYLAFSL